jgi:hypothetical protein
MIFIYPAIVSSKVDERYISGITKALEKYFLFQIGEAFQSGVLKIAVDKKVGWNGSEILSDYRLESNFIDDETLKILNESLFYKQEVLLEMTYDLSKYGDLQDAINYINETISYVNGNISNEQNADNVAGRIKNIYIDAKDIVDDDQRLQKMQSYPFFNNYINSYEKLYLDFEKLTKKGIKFTHDDVQEFLDDSGITSRLVKKIASTSTTQTLSHNDYLNLLEKYGIDPHSIKIEPVNMYTDEKTLSISYNKYRHCLEGLKHYRSELEKIGNEYFNDIEYCERQISMIEEIVEFKKQNKSMDRLNEKQAELDKRAKINLEKDERKTRSDEIKDQKRLDVEIAKAKAKGDSEILKELLNQKETERKEELEREKELERRYYEDQKEKQRKKEEEEKVRQASEKEVRTQIKMTPMPTNEYSLHPENVTTDINLITYDHSTGKVLSEKKSFTIGVKILNIKMTTTSSIYKALIDDLYSNRAFYLYKSLTRWFFKKFVNTRIFKYFASSFDILFGTTSGRSDVGLYKDILLKNKGYIDASSFSRKMNTPKYTYFAAGIIILSHYDIQDKDHNFFEDPGKVRQLFRMGWNTFVITNDVASKLIFCSYLENGMCARLPYAVLYGGKVKDVYSSLEQLKTYTGQVLGAFKKVDYKNLYDLIK